MLRERTRHIHRPHCREYPSWARGPTTRQTLVHCAGNSLLNPVAKKTKKTKPKKQNKTKKRLVSSLFQAFCTSGPLSSWLPQLSIPKALEEKKLRQLR